MRKIIPEGGEIPRGYGATWRVGYNFNIICYPIPLNLIIRLYLHYKYAVMRGLFRSKYENELLRVRFEGKCEEYNKHKSELLNATK